VRGGREAQLPLVLHPQPSEPKDHHIFPELQTGMIRRQSA
jgi:hypothetical protein